MQSLPPNIFELQVRCTNLLRPAEAEENVRRSRANNVNMRVVGFDIDGIARALAKEELPGRLFRKTVLRNWSHSTVVNEAKK